MSPETLGQGDWKPPTLEDTTRKRAGSRYIAALISCDEVLCWDSVPHHSLTRVLRLQELPLRR